MIALVPLIVLALGLLGSLCCKAKPEFCWCCFGDDDDSTKLVIFSSFAGEASEEATAELDEKYVHQHRVGGVYTWAKQFHGKFVVQGTPTGLKMAQHMRAMEREQLLGYKQPKTKLLRSLTSDSDGNELEDDDEETKAEGGGHGDEEAGGGGSGAAAATEDAKILQLLEHIDDVIKHFLQSGKV